MTEQQKSQPVESSSTQDPQQLQILLKETLKENKTLVSKNSKLEGKYVELFKQNKLLKQDRNVFVQFCTSYFVDADGKPLEEAEIGQLKKQTLEAAGQFKINSFIKKVQQLESKILSITEELKNQASKEAKELTEKLNSQWQARVKKGKDQQSKEVNSLAREVESLKKSNEIKGRQLAELKSRLETTTQQMSKLSKEKLKMEHHLNNLRKRQISQQLSQPKETDESKTLVDKNEYLALKQHVDSLMSKRDELRRELKKKQQQLANQHRTSLATQQQLDKLRHAQQENSEKFQLIKECTLEELENMIISYHATQSEKQLEDKNEPVLATNGSKKYVEIEMTEEKAKNQTTTTDHKLKKRTSTEQQIKRQYLKNMVARYIKAQTTGNSQQSMTLLEIIGRLVGLDGQSSQNLSNYISKHKQWWYLKY